MRQRGYSLLLLVLPAALGRGPGGGFPAAARAGRSALGRGRDIPRSLALPATGGEQIGLAHLPTADGLMALFPDPERACAARGVVPAGPSGTDLLYALKSLRW